MSILQNTGKATLYNTNGTGRDTYIYCNSGGFTATNGSQVQPPIGMYNGLNLDLLCVGTFCSPIKKSDSKIKKPVINSKAIHYNSNGTGRDTYIMYTLLPL